MAIDRQQVSCLCLSDISAAVNTIDHVILTKRTYHLWAYLESLNCPIRLMDEVFPFLSFSHALSLSMLLVTYLICNSLHSMFFEVLFSVRFFSSFFTPPHATNSFLHPLSIITSILKKHSCSCLSLLAPAQRH